MPTTSPAKASSAMRAVLREEELRRAEPDRLAGADQLRPHAPHAGLTRAHPHEGDAVAVVRIHVRLDLEDEARHASASFGSTHEAGPRPAARAAAARIRPASRSGRARRSCAAREPKKTGVRCPGQERRLARTDVAARPAASPRSPPRQAATLVLGQHLGRSQAGSFGPVDGPLGASSESMRRIDVLRRRS